MPWEQIIQKLNINHLWQSWTNYIVFLYIAILLCNYIHIHTQSRAVIWWRNWIIELVLTRWQWTSLQWRSCRDPPSSTLLDSRKSYSSARIKAKTLLLQLGVFHWSAACEAPSLRGSCSSWKWTKWRPRSARGRNSQIVVGCDSRAHFCQGSIIAYHYLRVLVTNLY